MFKSVTIATLCVICIGCNDPLEKQLLEVNRLSELRDTTEEILREQKTNVEKEIRNFNAYNKAEEDHIADIAASLRKSEKSLRYWKNWHIEEEKRRRWHAKNNRDIDAASAKMDLDAARYELNEALAAKKQAVVGVNYLQAMKNIDAKKREIAKYEKLVAQYEAGEVALVYEQPKRPTDKIQKAEADITFKKQEYDKAVKELDLKRRSFRDRIAKMNTDLKTTLAAYDSMDVMHRNAVLALSKMENK